MFNNIKSSSSLGSTCSYSVKANGTLGTTFNTNLSGNTIGTSSSLLYYPSISTDTTIDTVWNSDEIRMYESIEIFNGLSAEFAKLGFYKEKTKEFTEAIENIRIIRKKLYTKPVKSFNIRDLSTKPAAQLILECKFSQEDILNETIANIFQPHILLLFVDCEESFYEKIIEKFPENIYVMYSIVSKKISEELFEKIASTLEKKKFKTLLNIYIANNSVSEKFISKYIKEISISCLALKKRKTFSQSIRKILKKGIKDSYLPKQLISNLKIPSEEILKILEGSSPDAEIIKSLMDAAIFANMRLIFPKEIVEKTEFVESYFHHLCTRYTRKEYLTIELANRKALNNIRYIYPNGASVFGSTASYTTLCSDNFSVASITSKKYRNYDTIISEYATSLPYTLEKEPISYFINSENIQSFFSGIEKFKGDTYLFSNSPNWSLLSLVNDILEDADELDEGFFIKYFDLFTINNPFVFELNARPVSLIKEFTDVEDPAFSSLKLLYELKKMEEGFLELTDDFSSDSNDEI